MFFDSLLHFYFSLGLIVKLLVYIPLEVKKKLLVRHRVGVRNKTYISTPNLIEGKDYDVVS